MVEYEDAFQEDTEQQLQIRMSLFIRCSSCGLVTTLRFFCLPLPSLSSAFLFFFFSPSTQPCCFHHLRACNSFAVPSVYSLHSSKKQQNSKSTGIKVRSEPGEPTRTTDSRSVYLHPTAAEQQELMKTRTRRRFKGSCCLLEEQQGR